MITYKVFKHKNFRLVFSYKNGKTNCANKSVFDDENDTTFYDCENDAVNAVCNMQANPRFLHEKDKIITVYDAAVAFQVNVNEDGKETAPRKFICSNVPSLNKIEEFVGELFKMKTGA